MSSTAVKSTKTRQTESTTSMLDIMMTATLNLFLFCEGIYDSHGSVPIYKISEMFYDA